MIENNRPASFLPEDARTSLAQGQWLLTARQLRRATACGDTLAAALGKVILASRFRNSRSVLKAVLSPSVNALRSHPVTHTELALALFYAVNPAAAESELKLLLRQPETTAGQSAEARNLLTETQLARSREVRCAQSIAVALRSDKLPIVRMSINGMPEAPFLVDTGAANTLLSRAYAVSHGFKIIDGEIDPIQAAARNRVPISLCPVHQIRLGGVNLGSDVLAVATLPSQIAAAGLLSPFSLLRGCRWELDFANGLFRVHVDGESARATSKEWNRTPLYWDRGNVFVCATLDRRNRGFFLLDTGAGGNMITPAFASAIGIGPARQEVRTIDMQGATTVRGAGRHLLSIGQPDPLDGASTEMYLGRYETDPRDIAPIRCSGFVGMPWFEKRRILIEPEQKHLYFQDPA